MKWTLIILLVFLSISFINADIISINSYGSDEVVITPTQEIEGFFFGEIPTTTQPGGGFKPFSITNLLTKDYTCQIYERDGNLTEVFRNLSQNFRYQIDEEQIRKYVEENCHYVKYMYYWLWLIIVIMILMALTYYNRKRIMALVMIIEKKIKKST